MASLITLSMSLTRYNSTGSWPLSASLYSCCQATLLSASESDFLRFSKAPVFQHWVVKIMAYFFLMDKLSLSFHNSPILSSFFCLCWTSSGAFCFLAVSSLLPSWTLWGVQTKFSSKTMEILLTQGTNELRFLNLLADFNIRSGGVHQKRARLPGNSFFTWLQHRPFFVGFFPFPGSLTFSLVSFGVSLLCWVSKRHGDPGLSLGSHVSLCFFLSSSFYSMGQIQ